MLGNLEGVYPVDSICVTEYGEILLVDTEGKIVRAYPMPAAVPSWVHVTDNFVYAGRVGDGGLPDSALVRIDLSTLAATVVLVPAPVDGGQEWPSDWIIATDEQIVDYPRLVGVGPDSAGTEVTSWIGTIRVDLDGIDRLIDTLS